MKVIGYDPVIPADVKLENIERWGSCSIHSKKIRMNLQLAVKSEECVEYVLVHELCHLLEPSHNQRFYDLMSHFLPDWRERKQKLNEKV